uniref:HPP family protein n=1 Tax=Stutzerimonas nitrititolerans TaxID=2482751 RepID=UPI0035E3FB89
MTAPPKEWIRVALGIAIALAIALSFGIWLFGAAVMLPMAAPAAASAVLLFAASSSPFAQPWSVLAGNLVA